MAGVTGRAAGFIATLYYSASVIAVKNSAAMVTATASEFEVADVADMGALSKARILSISQSTVWTSCPSFRVRLTQGRLTSM